MFIRVRRLHDELIAGKLVCTLQVFTYKRSDQCALDVKSESVSVVDLIAAKGRLVSALRVLHRRSVVRRWRVSIHDLNRHLAVGRVDEKPRTIRPVKLAL